MIYRIILVFLLSINLLKYSSAQTDSTHLKNTEEKKRFSERMESFKTNKPLQASLLSLAVPGGGQVYNKQYWKLPIFYGALGSIAFTFDIFNKKYQKYKDGLIEHQNYIAALGTDSAFFPVLFPPETEENLLTVSKDKFRRNRDLSGLIFLAVYALNIIDATVYAHLSDFDVSDDLSIKFSPEIMPLYAVKNKNTVGLCITLKF